jgi:hypothetical protein
MKLAPLPSLALEILTAHHAPPRLCAHLTLVHDVAQQLCAQLKQRCPGFVVDVDAVAFGAAIHDVGKAVVVAELSGPGKEHEAVGFDLLRAYGVESRRARFAVTHGLSPVAEGVDADDLVVQLADAVWKGKRSEALESEVVRRMTSTSLPAWQAFSTLDAILTSLARDADARLAFQARHPVAHR